MNNFKNNSIQVLGMLFFLSSVMACKRTLYDNFNLTPAPGIFQFSSTATEQSQVELGASLRQAVILGETDKVQNLLMLGADPSLSDDDGLTPLNLAAQNGHVEIVQLLLKKGGSMQKDKRDKQDKTPLYWAAEKGHVAVVNLLLEAKASVGEMYAELPSALHWAALGGHPEVVKILLQAGARSCIRSGDKYKQTSLHYAAANGHTQVVEILLSETSQTAPLNYVDQTPLHLAAEKGHVAVVNLLLKAGGEFLNVHKDIHGQTPLHYAAAKGHTAVVEILLKTGAIAAVVYEKSKTGQTPLYLAIQNGHLEVVKRLLEAERAAPRGVQSLPLHWAAEKGRVAIVEFLLRERFDVNARNIFQSTPLHQAASFGHTAVIERLLQVESINVHAQNNAFETAFSMALNKRSWHIAWALLEHDSNVMKKVPHTYTHYTEEQLRNFLNVYMTQQGGISSSGCDGSWK